MREKIHHNLIIIGSGPAGFTAAIYAGRANMKPVLMTGLVLGGQLTTTTDVDNWPGYPDGIQGPTLMENLQSHAEKYCETIYEYVHEVDFSQKPFLLKCDDNDYTCDSLIISTGATAKYLGLDSEEYYKGKGVSACATCDGFFFKGKDVVVVGGGNTAIEEALYLSNIVNKVTLIHRRDTFKAEKIMIDKMLNKVKEGKIELCLNATVSEVQGDGNSVEGVLVSLEDNKSKIIKSSGVFIAIGHNPNTDLFKKYLKMDNSGYLITKGGREGYITETSIPGIFAAGDVQDHIYKQAITSAASGCQAALDAERYLSDNL